MLYNAEGYKKETLTIPNTVVSVTSVACGNNRYIKKIVLSNTMEEIGWAAFVNTGITELTLPASVKDFDPYSVPCTTGIKVDSASKFFTVTSDGVLYDKNKTALYFVPSSVKKLTLPNTLKTIKARAVVNNMNLTSLVRPAGVTKIESPAFNDCDNIKSVTMPAGLSSYDVRASCLYEGRNSTTGKYGIKEGFVMTVYPDSEAQKYCEEESIKTKVLAQCKHTSVYTETKQAEKCGDWTYEYTRCSKCGKLISGKSISRKNHTASNWKTLRTANCQVTGVKCADCLNCNKAYAYNVSPLAAHKFGSWTQISRMTPLVNGSRTHTCTACGVQQTETVTKANKRVYGKTRYETSRLIADESNMYPNQKMNGAIIVSGSDFADALSATYLSSIYNIPIILTGTNETSNVADYVKKHTIQDGTIYIIGGEGAVDKNTEDKLKAAGCFVTRLAGSNRYLTNIKTNEYSGQNSTLLVASGLDFADALSASSTGYPILLVGNSLTYEQKQYLSSLNKLEKVYMLGGTGAVSETVEKQLKECIATKTTFKRVGGANRYETSAMIAREFAKSPKSMVLAYGQTFPDGLCGGLLAKENYIPLVLTAPGRTDYAKAYAQKHNITTAYILGGPSLISDADANTIVKN